MNLTKLGVKNCEKKLGQLLVEQGAVGRVRMDAASAVRLPYVAGHAWSLVLVLGSRVQTQENWGLALQLEVGMQRHLDCEGP